MGRTWGTDDFREPILEYLSQEMNTHASMIVGFSVVLFAYLDIIVRHYFEPPIFFKLGIPSTWGEVQYILVFLVLVAIVGVLIFVGLRLGFYGLLTVKTLEYSKPSTAFKDMWDKLVDEEIKDAKVFALPASWFKRGFFSWSWGLVVSFTMSILICLALAFTLFLKIP